MIDAKNKDLISNNADLKRRLFHYGFLITDADDISEEDYPFYNNWQTDRIGDYNLFVSPSQTYYIQPSPEGGTYVLIGHCMNPFNGTYLEQEILTGLGTFGSGAFFDRINELTGVFTLFYVKNTSISIVGDPCCIQTVYYGILNQKIYVSSHDNLLGDLLGLERDTYVKKLCKYKFFHFFGSCLPGNLSQFAEFKRLVPNHFITICVDMIEVKRFYTPHTLEISENEIAERVSLLLSNTLEQIPKKFKRPAISLSGGCDSKTTLSCCKEPRRYRLSSFISSDVERVDAIAAQKICKALHLDHQIYEIPFEDQEIEGVEPIRYVLNHNNGELVPCNANDVRKQAVFSAIDDFDVEVKSWCSEIGRAYYAKRFSKRSFGRITPRKCTTLYKVFFHNRRLVLQTDRVFKEYLKEYSVPETDRSLPWQEWFYWEYQKSSWNGVVITGQHRFSHNITIPYNNRLLLELLLSAPFESRVHDTIYQMIRDSRNPMIDQAVPTVVNVKHTARRAKMERAYYYFNTLLPF